MGNSLFDATGKVYMIIFQQDHIEQSDTMVDTAADLYSILFHHTHTGSCFAGIQHIFAGCRCNTAHTLHNVQHQAFCL